MDYVVEFNPRNGRYQMVMFQKLEGNVKLEMDVVPLHSKDYSDAVAEAERNELLADSPFVLDMDDLVIEEMAEYYYNPVHEV
jgi:hypothetical protein